MSRRLIRIEEGDPIPDDARFVTSEVVRGEYSHTTHSERPYLFFWEHHRTVTYYKPKRIYIYEIPSEEQK